VGYTTGQDSETLHLLGVLKLLFEHQFFFLGMNNPAVLQNHDLVLLVQLVHRLPDALLQIVVELRKLLLLFSERILTVFTLGNIMTSPDHPDRLIGSIGYGRPLSMDDTCDSVGTDDTILNIIGDLM